MASTSMDVYFWVGSLISDGKSSVPNKRNGSGDVSSALNYVVWMMIYVYIIASGNRNARSFFFFF